MQSTSEVQSTSDINKPAHPPAVDPGPSTQRSGLSAPDKELVARADERLAHAYQQIALADEQLARMNQQMARLGPEAGDQPGRQPPRHGSALRGVIGLLLAACIFSAAFASQFASDATLHMMSRWAPQAVSASMLPQGEAQLSAETGPAVQVATADDTTPLPPAAQPQQEAAPITAQMPPELTQLLQTISNDLANVKQTIDALKASQEQLTRDQATTAELVKANQEQVARLLAASAEQNQRSAAVPQPRPVTAPPRKPASTQAGMQPIQLRPTQR